MISCFNLFFSLIDMMASGSGFQCIMIIIIIMVIFKCYFSGELIALS